MTEVILLSVILLFTEVILIQFIDPQKVAKNWNSWN